MERVRIFGHLCLGILLCIECEAFLPNQYAPHAKPDDYTHADITEIGILNAVAAFLETVAAPGKAKVAPDTLTGITNKTTRKIYDAYYGTSTSDVPFQNAIDTIIKHNNKVDQDHYHEAAWHFNGEQIEQANQKLIQLRANILHELSLSSPVYETARQFIGQFYHLLQMFYSNSNWINLYKKEIYQDLGIPGKTLMKVAPKDLDMCHSCGPIQTLYGQKSKPCVFDMFVMIKHNITYLTSSYRSGQDVQKPYKDPKTITSGKCSHGDPNDLSANNSAALGGINKDTSDHSYSPQAFKHKYAAQQAINHTTYFLTDPVNGILSKIGNDKFIELLQLQPTPSLVFVVDTTKLMHVEIEAVTNKTIAIVQATNGTVNQPYNYILVTFNDPASLTKMQKTNDAAQMITWLNGITAKDANPNNDCPEFSLTGLSAASVVASYGSKIYLFTDAAPKDPNMINYITSLLTEKNLKIEFFLTGQCTTRRKRSNPAILYDGSAVLKPFDIEALVGRNKKRRA